MLKYKNTYKVITNKDNNGKVDNKLDNYIQCVPLKTGIQIYRYNDNTLVVQFNSSIIRDNRIKKLNLLGVILTPFQIGDDESTYFFKESDLEQVAEVVKARKRIKRDLTDEQRQELRERLINSRQKMIL